MGTIEDFQRYCILLKEEGYVIYGGNTTSYSLEKQGSNKSRAMHDIKINCKKCAIKDKCKPTIENGTPPTIYADLE